MLVLSRKANSSIVIGSNIRVTVLSISRQRIKLGIDAPLEVPVMRGELCEESLLDEVSADDMSRGEAIVGLPR